MKKDNTPSLLKVVRWLYPKVESVFPSLAHRYFVEIFFTPLRYRVPEKEKILAARAEKFTVQASGKRIQCYSWGEGPVVLLVHGWAGRGTQFRKIIETFWSKGYRVVSFDGPAHGRSDGRKTNIVEFNEALEEVYKVTGVPEGIIAHSFGGSAVLFAAMNGLQVRRLINIASPTIGDEIINTYLRAVHASAETGKFFKSYISKKYGRTFDEFTSLHFIRHIGQEIDLLLVHDENDEEVIPAHATELRKVYPRARVLITRGLGHTRILKDAVVLRNCVAFIRDGRIDTQTGN